MTFLYGALFMPAYELAQLNIAELKHPLDSPELKDFVDNLDSINQLAEESDGFVWRLQTDEGDATSIDYFGDKIVVNMSVWENHETLHNYVYRSAHVNIMRRKMEWFEKMKSVHMVLWWVPAGHRPSLEEADEKLRYLDKHGPSPEAFTFKKSFAAPET